MDCLGMPLRGSGGGPNNKYRLLPSRRPRPEDESKRGKRDKRQSCKEKRSRNRCAVLNRLTRYFLARVDKLCAYSSTLLFQCSSSCGSRSVILPCQ
ncbi:uncharacterized protein BDV14DRAFT_64732 [Aspergillus stella-maris]|uniref:uncharacterized protein n=1 Tax=Aspergillus stella-maris TaxID=1810926 RepID=UPI003CCD61A3